MWCGASLVAHHGSHEPHLTSRHLLPRSTTHFFSKQTFYSQQQTTPSSPTTSHTSLAAQPQNHRTSASQLQDKSPPTEHSYSRIKVTQNVHRSPPAPDARLQTHANRPPRRRQRISHRRQRHDMVNYLTSSPSISQPQLTSLFHYRNAVIIGPSDTPFEDGTFRLVMHFEEQYPNKPPGVKFISQMFHPNVYGTGELCLDILQNRWSPTYDVAAILTSIQR